MIRFFIYSLFACLIVFQFFRIEKTNPIIKPENDFFASTLAQDKKTNELIIRACGDCHTNSTKYPWYTNIAPLSWWIKHHINEGREELNFSEWATYSEKRKKHKIEECIEEIESEEMPLKSYLYMHPEAKLNQEERALLIQYFKSLLVEIKL